jgi:hypothetical protein
VWDIRVTRWTTPDERTKLLGQVVENDTNVLLKALLKLPSHGRISVPGHQEPDPQGRARLDAALVFHTPLPEGGHRLVLATDRYVTFQEARSNPRAPWTIRSRCSRSVSTRTAKASAKPPSPKIGIEPVRLNQVKVEE